MAPVLCTRYDAKRELVDGCVYAMTQNKCRKRFNLVPLTAKPLHPHL